MSDRIQQAQQCEGGQEAHYAHMEMNGECPWCGAYDPEQNQFGHIGDDGTVYAADGTVIEYGST